MKESLLLNGDETSKTRVMLVSRFKCTTAYPAIISKKLNVYLECLSKGLMQNYNLTSQGAETLGGQTTGD
jgi:hypothetical protein